MRVGRREEEGRGEGGCGGGKEGREKARGEKEKERAGGKRLEPSLPRGFGAGPTRQTAFVQAAA